MLQLLPSASTDDDESIVETEQLEFLNKAKKDILEFSSSAEADASTSPSASTDDDESIVETEQLEFYSASIISLFPIYIVRDNRFN
jgi:hypothetical protein